MNHQDHVSLLRKAVAGGNGPWADLGSGEGAFTLALRDLVGPNIDIYSVERDEARLYQQQRNFLVRFPESRVHFLLADFTRPLELPPLGGMVIANALHFFSDKVRILQELRRYLQDGGRLIVVEYNVDKGNSWVPYPFSNETFRKIASQAGLSEPELMATVPSSFLRQIYSAMAINRPGQSKTADPRGN
jgi:ubiquinone/menaquinone biosynthesis C-methylase UbiE